MSKCQCANIELCLEPEGTKAEECEHYEPIFKEQKIESDPLETIAGPRRFRYESRFQRDKENVRWRYSSQAILWGCVAGFIGAALITLIW